MATQIRKKPLDMEAKFDSRHKVCSSPGRGVLDVVIAGHVLRDDCDGIGLVPCQEERRGEPRDSCAGMGE